MSADPSAQEIPVGQVFEGKYKILRELGRGGFGMVYLAFQEGMDRHVALKVLRSSVTAKAPSAKDRFLREVKIISKLKHPNTVTIHDFGETYDGGLYMVLEFVEGETLKQVLKREGPQDVLRAADLARQVARSLAEAHRHGVVHRDLKPANIMITSLDTDRDFVKVLDFGVARLLDAKTDDLTSVGLPEGERELIGTPRYMSPEQVRGESLNGASDIYGLGLMLYELLCGEPAVQGDTTMGLITQQISPEPLKLPRAGAFDPIIQDIIRIATAKQVTDRFQTAEQMADALEQAVFQIRRDRNMSGGHQHDDPNMVPMSGYNSQLAQMQPGYNPGSSGFNSSFNSGLQPGGFGSGQWDRASGAYNQMRPGPGFGPQASGYDPLPNDDHWEGGAGFIDEHGSSAINARQGPYASGAGPMAGVPAPALQPGGVNSGFNEIELPIDDDFQPTVERDALDPAQLIQRPQGMFDRNQHPSAGLPPVPQDERPFAPKAPNDSSELKPGPKPGRARRQTAPPPRIDPPPPSQLIDRRPAHDGESLSQFSLSVLKSCVLAVLAIGSVYFAFIVVGALLGPKASGTARLLAAAAIAMVLPALAVFGEMSNRERFRIVEGTVERVGRVLLNTAVFAVAVVIIGTGACANDVVYELQDEPNWFLANPEGRGFASMNKRVSYSLASLVVDVMGTVGLYDKKKRVARVTSPDAPGRTPALPQPTRKGNEQPLPTRPTDDAKDLRDSKEAKSDYEEW